MNIFTGTGICGKDAVVRYLASGTPILNVSIAVKSGYGEREKTIWLNASVFGKRAEGKLKDYLLKGTQVAFSGELSENEYIANDGTTKKTLELNANILDLVGGKRDQSGTQNTPQGTAQQHSHPQNNNFPDDFDDDIPF